MKKILIFAAVVALMTACNNQTQTTETAKTIDETADHEERTPYQDEACS